MKVLPFAALRLVGLDAKAAFPVGFVHLVTAFEPGGRRFESVRARFSIKKLLSINAPTVAKT